MKLFVNNRETDLPGATTLRELMERLQLPERGVAAAVNNKMIPRSGWGEHLLQEGDRVTIIQAACGG